MIWTRSVSRRQRLFRVCFIDRDTVADVSIILFYRHSIVFYEPIKVSPPRDAVLRNTTRPGRRYEYYGGGRTCLSASLSIIPLSSPRFLTAVGQTHMIDDVSLLEKAVTLWFSAFSVAWRPGPTTSVPWCPELKIPSPPPWSSDRYLNVCRVEYHQWYCTYVEMILLKSDWNVNNTLVDFFE